MHIQQGRTADALRHLETAADLDAASEVGRCGAGLSLAALGQRERAIECLQRALALQSDAEPVRQKLQEIQGQPPPGR